LDTPDAPPQNVTRLPDRNDAALLKRDGLRLYRAFMSIRNREDRLKVILLAESLAPFANI